MGSQKISSKSEVANTHLYRVDLRTFLLLIIFYLLALLPMISSFIPGGDSGEIVVNSLLGGTLHPPGYPLYSMVLRALAKLSTPTNFSQLASIFSAGLSAGAAAFIGLIGSSVTGNLGVGAALGLLFLYSPGVIDTALAPEVFGLHHFVLAGIYTLVFLKSPERKLQWGVPVLFGVGVANHHLILLALPALWLWWRGARVASSGLSIRSDPRARHKRLLVVIFATLGGVALYFLLPLLAKSAHGTGWGDFGKFADIFKHLFRTEYGTFRLAAGESASVSLTLQRAWPLVLRLIVEGVSTWASALGLILFLLWNQHRLNWRHSAFMWFWTASTLFAFFCLSNLDLSWPLYQRIWLRFFGSWWILGFFALVTLLVGDGRDFSLIRKSFKDKKAIVLVLVLLSGAQFLTVGNRALKLPKGLLEEFAVEVLEQLPKTTGEANSKRNLLLSSGDHITHHLLYQQKVKKRRPDVMILDTVYLTKSWSTEKFSKAFPELKFPGLVLGPGGYTLAKFIQENREKFEHVFIVNGVRIEDSSLDPSYDLIPWGWSEELVERETQRGPLLAGRNSAILPASLPSEAWDGFFFSSPLARSLGDQAWDSWEYDLFRLFLRQRFSYASRTLKAGAESKQIDWVLKGVKHLEGVEERLQTGAPVPFAPLSNLYRNLAAGYQLLLPSYPQLQVAYERSRKMSAEMEAR
jgi:hypothetical protein